MVLTYFYALYDDDGFNFRYATYLFDSCNLLKRSIYVLY